jgi:hypothetical protein
MTAIHDDLVRVQSDWKDWRTVEVRLRDVTDLHWSQPAGAPHALLHGYISCASIVSGELSHRCDQSSAPHRLLVCALKRRTPTAIYAIMALQADAARNAKMVLPPASRMRRVQWERR